MIPSDTPDAEIGGELLAPTNEWSVSQRIAFRFCFAYFLLHGLPLLLLSLPFANSLDDQWFLGTVAIGRWLIVHVLHLPAHGTPSGTDRLDIFLFDMLLVGISIVVALAWSVLDRRHSDYGRLYAWLYALVRFALAAEMFVYGWSKLLPYQFWGGQVPLFDLAGPLGNLHPNGLLWAMMGFSRPYAIFAGAVEWIGALLLCFRRTATLGAVMLIGTLTNVVMLNFAFDVGVKLGATNLLIMALFVAAPDMNRFVKMLVLNQPTQPRRVEPLFRSASLTRLTAVGAVVAAALLVYQPLASMLPDLRADGPYAPPPPLYGIFVVDSVARNGATIPLLPVDTTTWRRVVFERSHRASVTLMSDSVLWYRATADSNARTVQLLRGFGPAGPVDTLRLSYARPDVSHLAFRGVVGGDSLVMWLHKTPASHYRLINAQHHWAW